MSQPTMPDRYRDIHSSIVQLLEEARRAAARSVNALMRQLLGNWPAHRRSRTRRVGEGRVWRAKHKTSGRRPGHTLWTTAIKLRIFRSP